LVHLGAFSSYSAFNLTSTGIWNRWVILPVLHCMVYKICLMTHHTPAEDVHINISKSYIELWNHFYSLWYWDTRALSELHLLHSHQMTLFNSLMVVTWRYYAMFCRLSFSLQFITWFLNTMCYIKQQLGYAAYIFHFKLFYNDFQLITKQNECVNQEMFTISNHVTIRS
jgi:hypothetical protein